MSAVCPKVARPNDLVLTSAHRHDTFEASVGRFVDDTSGPWYRGQVAGHGDTIVAAGPMVDDRAAHVIDAAGLVVWPGFIDIHTYPGRGPSEVPTADTHVSQGRVRVFGESVGRPVWPRVVETAGWMPGAEAACVRFSGSSN